jgi:hypothetical protein
METEKMLAKEIVKNKPPLSKERRKQLVWMIWVPLFFGALLILAAAVLVALPTASTNVDTASLGSLSFIWIAAPWVLVLLAVMAIAGAKVYLIAKLLQILPGYFQSAQFYARLIAQKTQEFADQLVKPVIAIKARQSSVELAAHKLGIKSGHQK